LKNILIRAVKISIVVGILLNIINQGDYIFNMEYEKINFIKIFLTFLVPFGVSLYSALSMNSKKYQS